MLTYSRDQLQVLNHDRPPCRAVRKSLFKHYLWRPARSRLRAQHSSAHRGRRGSPVTSAPKVNNNTRSADSFMTIGWLNVQSLTNKSVIIEQLITERPLNVLALTETWHGDSDDSRLRLAVPTGFAVIDAARQSGRGGGVAVIFPKHVRCSRVQIPECTTFEALCVRLSTSSGPVILLTVYRPGSVRPTSTFYEELSSVLELLVVHSCPVVMGGDFNIHVDDANDPETRRLNELLAAYSVHQYVDKPTHRCGRTLDLVMTFMHHQVSEVSVDPAGVVSDHSLVTCQLPVATDQAAVVERIVRGWRRVDHDELRRVLLDSPLCQPVSQLASADDLFAEYHNVLQDVADRVAPQHSLRRRVGRMAPWFDNGCRQARRECRRLERRYRRSRAADDRGRWIEAVRRKFGLYKSTKEAYWQHRLLQDGRSPAALWRSLSSVLGRDRDTSSTTDHTADGFADFFARKVETVREATSGAETPPATAAPASSSFQSFSACSPATVRRVVMTSPVKSCTLDPVPTFLLREFIDLLLPYITAMVNASLSQGRFPSSQKHAVITPLLKKAGLDTTDMGNYRPVSNLPFMSKVVERLAAAQLHQYLAEHRLLPCRQSAYRRSHSTETAIIDVLSDAFTAADEQQVTLMGLLDLSAAFDCVDHELLLYRLRQNFGFSGAVLKWLTSFVTGRTHQVAFNGQLSPVQPVLYGVPQGSCLGPLLFVLYTAELSQVVAQHRLTLHQYADDCQIYDDMSPSDVLGGVSRFERCLVDVEKWMRASRLRLNASKTNILWLGSRHIIDNLSVQEVKVVSSTITTVTSARNLGVVIDSRLTMSDHVAAVCRAGYYRLRQLRPTVKSLPVDAAKTLIQAFISNRLDYCNAALCGITDTLLRKLQSVQNAAARLLTRTGRREHITPVLKKLHWLPVRLSAVESTLSWQC